MAHFNLENDISSALRMDAPITKGPQMRWQRKLNESSNISRNANESFANCSLNASTTSKTPKKIMNLSISNGNKTPTSKAQKTPGKGKTTPGRGNKTPTTAGDRFIPNRNNTQFEVGHHLLNCGNENIGADPALSPSQREYQKTMNENLNGECLQTKIISYKSKAPNAPEGYQSNLKVLYSQGKTPGTGHKTSRHIPQVPERILDAPEILDDYYLNLLDFSSSGLLAVCLGGHVYLWNASTGEIQQLLEMESPEEYVSSVAWEGNYLAIGTSSATVQLWDVDQQKRLRTMTGHAARVGSMSWNSHILSSGSRSGMIHHHDVRQPDHLVARLAGHSQEICGLKWSPDGRYLASGGNDNILNIWSAQVGTNLTDNTPLYSLSQHQAAVKALAWCPWQPSLLASGGGTADRNIKFWNCNTGTLMNSVDTKSQVCSILWSKEYKELISGHGFAQNQLIIWKYPTMTKVTELTGHTSRVLHLAMSPDGSTVVSAAADETLRLWKCFATDPAKKKTMGKSSNTSLQQGTLRGNIR